MIYYRILNMVPCAKLPNNKISLMKLKKKKETDWTLPAEILTVNHFTLTGHSYFLY